MGVWTSHTGGCVLAVLCDPVPRACCPCSMSRMVGYDAEADSMDSDTLRHYILGGHVAAYMRYLNEEDEEKYKAHFSRFIKEGVTADSVYCGVCACVLLVYAHQWAAIAVGGIISKCSSEDQSRSHCTEKTC